MDRRRAVAIEAGGVVLEGVLEMPARASGIVVFAHGSGSSRHSPRNQLVAQVLREHGMGTLLVDLLSPDEEEIDRRTRELRFDIPLLASRLEGIGTWVRANVDGDGAIPLGYFGASTGAAAALIAAADQGDAVAAVVSRGGRPDLAGDALGRVTAPTLLIVGGDDVDVLALNRKALERLAGTSRLLVVPGATHLFEEPGTLEVAAAVAAGWFAEAFGRRRDAA
ncbi:dienelactone hydrolase family protein [Acuticoccus mangrovi]|uniref:Hydrolase n=1 Tax=Acuticoccus mangrovi TaxID=2796142 RepID=A0A934IQ67_9HYPH|nr:hypothetical protein [Acuticoccus mangrovi]MBJ3776588.1 hypothetical protein [Acuticoccus mangrovi]